MTKHAMVHLRSRRHIPHAYEELRHGRVWETTVRPLYARQIDMRPLSERGSYALVVIAISVINTAMWAVVINGAIQEVADFTAPSRVPALIEIHDHAVRDRVERMHHARLSAERLSVTNV